MLVVIVAQGQARAFGHALHLLHIFADEDYRFVALEREAVWGQAQELEEHQPQHRLGHLHTSDLPHRHHHHHSLNR
jgi:hypothetical protein